MKNKLFIIVVVIFMFSLLSGCQSLPEPESSSDTLVVVDIERETEEGGSIFGYLALQIAPVNDPSATTEFTLNASEQYETAQGLPPGQYKAVSLKWEYQDAGKVIEYDPPADAFLVDAGALSIFPYEFRYTVQDGRMSFRWDRMSDAARDAFIAEELSGEESLGLWRVLE
jgi:hypothetical protein